MKPIRTKLITILLTLCLCLSLLPPAALAKDAERAGSGKLIALTFDDGPCKDTLRLLDGLKQRGVKATFFMLGSNAAAYPDIVKRAYEEGHQIASHTYDHSELTKLSDGQIQSQVTRTRNALNAAIGAKNAYIVRPPYGAYNQRVLDLLGAAAIYWSVDSNDWRWTNNADKTVDEIMKYTGDGDIILIHDIHTWSVDAALRAIDRLKAQGFTFVTVSELFRRRGATLQAGKIYFSKKSSGSDLPAIQPPKITRTVSRTQSFVTILADPGTVIHYTTDGSVPNADSPVYTGNIPLTGKMTVKAVAGYDMNGSRSDCVTAELSPADRAPMPRITIGNAGLVTLSGPVGMFYTTDGSWPTEQSNRYDGPFTVARGTVVQAICFDPRGELLASSVAKACYSHQGFVYTDVFPGSWYYEDIDYAAAMGLLKGLGQDRMGPDEPLTRGMLVTILGRMTGAGETGYESGFSDVPDSAWYAPSVSWARDAGIVEGYPDGTFRPDQPITREQLITILFRYSRRLRLLQNAERGDLTAFADFGEVSGYAADALSWGIGSGLIKGVSPDTLGPAETATRAQMAAMLRRLSAYFETQQAYYMDETALRGLADEVLFVLADKDLQALAGYVHPERGLTFSPYSTVEEDHITLSCAELVPPTGEIPTQPVLTWGLYDGSGEPIELTFDAYWDRFVWCGDFTQADEIGLDRICRNGNAIENVTQAYPDCQFVDYTLDSYLGYGDGIDWASLKLVFQHIDDRWYLVAIVHGEWTI